MTKAQQINTFGPTAQVFSSDNAEELKRQERGTSALINDSLASSEKKAEVKAKDVNNEVALPHPGNTAKGSGKVNQGGNIIALLGMILMLSMKTNSTFQKITWNEGSNVFNAQMKMAGVIGDAVKGSYTAQANISKNMASMSSKSGWISIGFAALTAGVGTMGGLNAASSEAGAGAEDGLTATGETEELDGPAEESVSFEDEEIEGNEERPGSATRREAGAKGGAAKKWPLRLKKILEQTMGTNMFFQGISSGIDSLTVQNPGKKKEADLQIEQGKQETISKESEIYVQGDGQVFGRDESQRQSADQYFQSTNQLYKSMADITTQSAMGLFQSV